VLGDLSAACADPALSAFPGRELQPQAPALEAVLSSLRGCSWVPSLLFDTAGRERHDARAADCIREPVTSR
jgi:hypothetical protein